jgi:hypothetical protein
VTLLAVVLAWTALSVLTVLGLGLLFAGRSRWQQWAAAPAETPAPAAPVALPLTG